MWNTLVPDSGWELISFNLFFWEFWGLNPGSHTCKANVLPQSSCAHPDPWPSFACCFFFFTSETGSCYIAWPHFAVHGGLGLISCLSILSSENCWPEGPPAPANAQLFHTVHFLKMSMTTNLKTFTVLTDTTHITEQKLLSSSVVL